MSAAVPFIAGAFLGPVGVALVTVTFAVTGMSAKIDKAAANVFGEDLVKVANIAGMAYGIYNGGFEIDGFGTDAVLAERAAATGAEMAASLNAAGYAPEAVAASTGTDMAASLNAAGYGSQAAAGSDMASSLNAAGYGSQAAADPMVASLSKAGYGAPQVAGVQGMPAAAPATQLAPSTKVAGSLAPSATAAPAASTAGNATKAIESVATKQITTPSFFDKLKGMATDPKFAGQLIAGVGSGYAAGQAADQQQAMYDQQRADRLRRSRIGTFSLKG